MCKSLSMSIIKRKYKYTTKRFFIDYIIETIETYFESSANIPKKLEVDDFGHLFKQLFIPAEQVNLQMLKKQYNYQMCIGFFLKKVE